MKTLSPILLLLLLFVACNRKPSDTGNPGTGSNSGSGNSIIGTIQSFSDGPYPMGGVQVIDDKGNSYWFDFNEAEGKFTTAQLSAWQGKTVSVGYTERMEDMAMDIVVGGKSLFSGDPKAKPEWKSCTGILDAPTVTESDLPGEFTLTEAGGKKYTFSFFVSEEMVAHNGKEATVFYSPTVQRDLLRIELVQ